MKKNVIFVLWSIIYLCSGSAAWAIDCPDCFITVWDTEENGISNDNQIIFPGHGSDYDIFWEEITDPSNNGSLKGNDATTIVLPRAGTYKLGVRDGEGSFHRISFPLDYDSDNPNSDAHKLLAVEQWGKIEWSSMNAAFAGCKNMIITASDTPDLSGVTDMSRMFYHAETFDQPIEVWDVSNVTNMAGMFAEAYYFDQPLDGWDVSNVTDMSEMFYLLFYFNQPLDNWDVSNVTNMSRMFAESYEFNQPIGDWDVSNVTNMSGMFADKEGSQMSAFNQPIGDWDVSNVTDMSEMFLGAYSFNQPIGDWDVSNVTDMSWMFSEAEYFNQDLKNWNVSNVTNMSGMLSGTTFDQPIGDWDVSNVTDMSGMFLMAFAFNQDLANWDVGEVTDMVGMFNSAYSFDQSLGKWKLNNGVNLFSMLDNSGMSCENYSATLYDWAANPDLPSNIELGADGIYYSPDAMDARDVLITKGWTIEGDELDETCIGIPTGIDEIKPLSHLLIYPNPSEGIFTIEIQSSKKEDIILKIVNILGQTVEEHILNDLYGKRVLKSDLSKLDKGIYIINLYQGDNVISRKVMVQ